MKFLISLHASIVQAYFSLALKYKLTFLPLVIRVEGGLGGQLMNIWLIEYLEGMGYSVAGDYSYFKRYRGQNGVSAWGWQAEAFGYKPPKAHKYTLVKKVLSLRDSELKFMHTLVAIRSRNNSYAKIDQELLDSFAFLNIRDHLVIHQRKGDYFNVASYVIDDKTIMDQVSSLITNCITCVYLSDGVISEELQVFLSERFQTLLQFDNNQISPELSHITLSKANTAIISNSQFSLSSGIFAKNTIFPPKWNGQKAWDDIFKSFVWVYNENKNF